MRRTTRSAFAAVIALGLIALSGCGGDDDSSDSGGQSTSSEATPTEVESPEVETPEVTASEEATTEATEEEPPAEPEGGPVGPSPAWAEPASAPGEKLTTVKFDTVTVDIYQVGTAPATQDGINSGDVTLKKGDEVVFYNVVLTNTSSKDVTLPSRMVDVAPRDEAWPDGIAQAMVSDPVMYQEMGINAGDTGAIAFLEEPPYVLAPGESISYGENFKYEKGAKIIWVVNFAPGDKNGKTLYEKAVEKKAVASLK